MLTSSLPLWLMLLSVQPSPRHQAIQVNNDGVELALAGNVEGAIKALRHATSVDPSYGQAWLNLGHLLRKQGQLDEAEAAFGSGAEADAPGLRGELHYQRGLILQRQARAAGLRHEERVAKMRAALEQLRAAANAEPWRALAHYRVGLSHEFLDEPAKADLAYRHAIEADPTLSAAYTALGSLYVDYGFDDVALAVLEVNVQVNEGSVDAWHGMGRELERIGRAADAIEAFEKAKRIDPDAVNVLFGLGMAHAELLHREPAEEALTQFLSKAGSDVPEHLKKAANQTIARMQDVL